MACSENRPTGGAQYGKALNASIQQQFGHRPTFATTSPLKNSSSGGGAGTTSSGRGTNAKNYNANVRIRNPPYVFPKTRLEEVLDTSTIADDDEGGKYSIAPHLNHRNGGAGGLRSSSSTAGSSMRVQKAAASHRFIDYREFSRTLSACLFNGFNDPDSYRCSMNQATHSPHVFAQQKEVRQDELNQWTRRMIHEQREEVEETSEKMEKDGKRDVTFKGTSSGSIHSTRKPIPLDPFNAYRRRNDPVLKQEERIYNQDQLMRSLK